MRSEKKEMLQPFILLTPWIDKLEKVLHPSYV